MIPTIELLMIQWAIGTIILGLVALYKHSENWALAFFGSLTAWIVTSAFLINWILRLASTL